MENNSYRKATAQIERGVFNSRQASFLFGELFFIAASVGTFKHSWSWGGGVFLALLVALAVKPLRILLVIILSLGWGVFGYFVGQVIGKEMAAAVIGGVIGFGIALVSHLAALEWMRDFSED